MAFQRPSARFEAMRVACLSLAAAFLLVSIASGEDAHGLLKRTQQRMETADYRANGHLVRADESGARTSYDIVLKAHWFPGVLRVLLEVTPPASAHPNANPKQKLDGRVHLLFEMRPNGHDSIQIAHPGDVAAASLPFDKWIDGPLGAGFSYEDFLESQYYWAGQSWIKAMTFGARKCDVLSSVPGAANKTHYAEVRTWLDHDIGFPVYVEKTLKGTGALKQFTYFGLRETGGVWSATQVEAKTKGSAGSTLLVINRGSAKANLGVKDFSTAQLTHF